MSNFFTLIFVVGVIYYLKLGFDILIREKNYEVDVFVKHCSVTCVVICTSFALMLIFKYYELQQ